MIVCMSKGYFFFLLNSPTTNRMTQAPTTAHTSCAHQEVPSVAPKSVYTQPPTTPPSMPMMMFHKNPRDCPRMIQPAIAPAARPISKLQSNPIILCFNC